MLRKSLIRKCVGGNSCAPARAAGVNFQACLIDRSSISPLSNQRLADGLEQDSAKPPFTHIRSSDRHVLSFQSFADTRVATKR